MCYNNFNEYSAPISFVFFIEKSKFEFVMITIPNAIEYLKKKFEMKGFRKQSFALPYRLSIQILKYLFIKQITSKGS